jgi:hypothetical protein
MYKLIRQADGETLGTMELPRYIHRAKNGCFAPCKETEAQGVAFDSVAYSLFGREPMAGTEVVLLVDQDGGKSVDALEATTADLQAALEESDAVAMDLYEASLEQAEINDQQDEAIMAIYEALEV